MCWCVIIILLPAALSSEFMGMFLTSPHHSRPLGISVPPFFGLDISDLSLKVMHVSRTARRDTISAFGTRDLPSGAITDGEINDQNVVQQAIRDVVAQNRGTVRTRYVTCSLPETKAFVRLLSLPILPAHELSAALQWEMEAVIPLSRDQVYYDWQILDNDFSGEKGHMNILLAAVARQTVDQFIAVIESAGLIPVALEVESLAQARSLLSLADGNRTVLIMDIGDRRTGFLIAANGIPCFTSSTSVSSHLITAAISSSLGIPLAEAEKLKRERGIGSPSQEDPLFSSVRSVLENLSDDLIKTIEFAQTALSPAHPIDRIILCGGGANTKGIASYLSRKVRIAIDTGDPWINCHFDHTLPPISREQSLQYSTAIGLALKEFSYANIS